MGHKRAVRRLWLSEVTDRAYNQNCNFEFKGQKPEHPIRSNTAHPAAAGAVVTHLIYILYGP